MDRRGFLSIMLAACAAPVYVRAGSLMRVNPAVVVPDITVTIQQYAQLYAYTEKTGELYPSEIGRVERISFIMSGETPTKELLGERKLIVADWRKGPLNDNAHWMKVK